MRKFWGDMGDLDRFWDDLGGYGGIGGIWGGDLEEYGAVELMGGV